MSLFGGMLGEGRGVGIEINFHFLFLWFFFTNDFMLTVNTPENTDRLTEDNWNPYNITTRKELLATFWPVAFQTNLWNRNGIVLYTQFWNLCFKFNICYELFSILIHMPLIYLDWYILIHRMLISCSLILVAKLYFTEWIKAAFWKHIL